MKRTYMVLKDAFTNPKVMALSGLLAMVPKSILAGVLAVFMGIFLRKSGFWPFFFFMYPIVGTIFDIMLYKFKDKLWKTLPESAAIPKDWKISSEQLLQFAKQLPKVRLMRLLGCLLMLFFVPFEGSIFLKILTVPINGYFICVFFDWIWLRAFKLKRPSFLIKSVNKSKPSDFKDPFERRRLEILRESDPYLAGTSAWVARKNRDSM